MLWKPSTLYQPAFIITQLLLCRFLVVTKLNQLKRKYGNTSHVSYIPFLDRGPKTSLDPGKCMCLVQLQRLRCLCPRHQFQVSHDHCQGHLHVYTRWDQPDKGLIGVWVRLHHILSEIFSNSVDPNSFVKKWSKALQSTEGGTRSDIEAVFISF